MCEDGSKAIETATSLSDLQIHPNANKSTSFITAINEMSCIDNNEGLDDLQSVSLKYNKQINDQDSTEVNFELENKNEIDCKKSVVEPEKTETLIDMKSSLNDNDTYTQALVISSTSRKPILFHSKFSKNTSLESECSSLESMPSENNSGEEIIADDFLNSKVSTTNTFTVLPMPSRQSPSVVIVENSDEKIDVGMGSSIEGSEESEEDDELKPLVIDNHVLYNIESKGLSEHDKMIATDISTSNTEATCTALSQANLEKFYKHQQHQPQQHFDLPLQMENIYLHPNFGQDYMESNEHSPPPAVAPANSPVESEKRVHRSFLTMKKTCVLQHALSPEKANSIVSHSSYTSDNKSSVVLSKVNEIDTLDPTLIPNDELADEITEAVEYYFSNDCILKDAFLLKHVRRNKEGFVSLKLVSSFKRIRQLAKDWRTVGYAVRCKSQKIQLNNIGTKVRRIEPLPNFDETMPSRTVVVCDLPIEKMSIEKVSDIFSKCGEIALIRILKPGMTIPIDVRQFMNKYPEMMQKECALVEFVESQSAREALVLEGPFKVCEMVAPKRKTGKKATQIQASTSTVRMAENYKQFNEQHYERTRGGSFSGIIPRNEYDLRYRFKRNNSDINHRLHYEINQSNIQSRYQPLNQSQCGLTSDNYSCGNDNIIYNPQFTQSTFKPRGSYQEVINHSPGINYNNYERRRYSNVSNNIPTSPNSLSSSYCTHSTHGINYNNSRNIDANLNMNIASVRRYSNCSQHDIPYSELSRRLSNYTEEQIVPQRRNSNCSDNCSLNRRLSDFGQNDIYRKTSQGSTIGSDRRFSNGSIHFERTMSNVNDFGNNNYIANDDSVNNNANVYNHRMSNEFNAERKSSMDIQMNTLPYADETFGNKIINDNVCNMYPRRYSNNFNNINSKIAAYDNAQYINGRRVSTDSGYDRRCSFGSEYSSSPRSRANSFLSNYDGQPRSRTGSLLSNYRSSSDCESQPRSRTGSFIDGSSRSRSGSFAQRTAESLLRTPIGPDGSKGFSTRIRRPLEIVQSVN